MLGLIIITVLGIVYRLVGIIKPEGLWNDEYVSWYIAAQPLNDWLIDVIKTQCHMPFYYMYLKMCMAFGGQSDLLLRISSVIPGILSIIVMYFVGLQKDKQTGLAAAGITALSSFLIYYSQEVRIYSVLFLFSALALLYFIKFIKNKTFTNLGGLILFDFLIMFTHTIGFVFLFFQLVGLSILLFKEYKKQILYIWGSIIILLALLVPHIYLILTTKSFSQWWGHFSISNIVFLFTDYFSPVLTNLVNAPNKILYVHSVSFIIFTFIPALIAIFFIGRSLYKNKYNITLAAISIGVIITLAVAAISGKLVFITKYSIEIYPILILLFAAGFTAYENKYVGRTLFTIFCVINLWYLNLSPVSAQRMPRPQGHKLPAILLENGQIKDNDIILFEYYPAERFGKYLDLSKYKTYAIHKGNFNSYLTPNTEYETIYKDGKNAYKDLFTGKSSGYLEYNLQKEIINNMKQGQSLFLITSDSVAIYPQEIVSGIAKDDFYYKKTPLMFMIFSYLKNQSYSYLSGKLSVARVEKLGDWSAVKFTKLNK